MNNEKKQAVQSLKTAKGQLEGIIKMIEEDRYCVDISNQLIAAQSLIKKANMLVLKQHLNCCVRSAFVNNDHADEKLDEVMNILNKITK